MGFFTGASVETQTKAAAVCQGFASAKFVKGFGGLLQKQGPGLCEQLRPRVEAFDVLGRRLDGSWEEMQPRVDTVSKQVWLEKDLLGADKRLIMLILLVLSISLLNYTAIQYINIYIIEVTLVLYIGLDPLSGGLSHGQAADAAPCGRGDAAALRRVSAIPR